MLQNAVTDYSEIFAWGLIGLAVLFLLFRRSVENFFFWLSRFLIFPEQRTFSEDRRKLPVHFFQAMYIVLIPVAAFMVYSTAIVAARYYIVLIVLFAYILLKELLLMAIGCWSKNTELASALRKMSGTFFFLSVLLAICLYSVVMFFPATMPVILTKIVPVIGGIALLWYFVRIVKIIFAFRKSLLFAICYLCTFEILPLGLVVAIMVKY